MAMSTLTLMMLVAFIGLSNAIGFQGRVNLSPVPGKTGPEAVLILIQGAQVPGLAYATMLAQVQNTSSLKLWCSSSDFVGNMPNPIGIGYEIDESLKELASIGMPANLPVFVAGHSLGGIIIQDWVQANQGKIDGVPRVNATLLFGSFLQRKYTLATYPTPVLQMAGTVDGLTRATRMMESFYHSNMNVTDDVRALNPVIAVYGMSHAQFFDGEPPELVKDRDFKPDIDLPTARQQIAIITANYLEQLLAPAPANAANVAKTLALVQNSGEFYAPLLNAFYQEGYAFFRMPCNLVNNASGCMEGCPWTEYMQAVFAKGDDGVAPGFDVTDHDDFQRVYHLPDVHLPEILNNCTKLENCHLLTRTVSQVSYSVPTWELDTAFYPQSGDEIRAKMSSRQRMYVYAGVPDADFDRLDGADWCMKLNQISYDWARNRTDQLTLKRFDSVGQPLMMGPDIVESSGGPAWIWSQLTFDDQTINGTLVAVVKSPAMKTPMNYWISFSRGFHYCKLLSPARAMEWIYVDGLRAHNGLKP